MGQTDQVEPLVEKYLTILRELPTMMTQMLETAKDMEADLRDLETCGVDPDTRFLGLLEDSINEVDSLNMQLLGLTTLQRTIAKECGWDVDFNEKRQEYIVTRKIPDA